MPGTDARPCDDGHALTHHRFFVPSADCAGMPAERDGESLRSTKPAS
jgi:hypothetical protein